VTTRLLLLLLLCGCSSPAFTTAWDVAFFLTEGAHFERADAAAQEEALAVVLARELGLDAEGIHDCVRGTTVEVLPGDTFPCESSPLGYCWGESTAATKTIRLADRGCPSLVSYGHELAHLVLECTGRGADKAHARSAFWLHVDSIKQICSGGAP